jgi:hypothetical protein
VKGNAWLSYIQSFTSPKSRKFVEEKVLLRALFTLSNAFLKFVQHQAAGIYHKPWPITKIAAKKSAKNGQKLYSQLAKAAKNELK